MIFPVSRRMRWLGDADGRGVEPIESCKFFGNGSSRTGVEPLVAAVKETQFSVLH